MTARPGQAARPILKGLEGRAAGARIPIPGDGLHIGRHSTPELAADRSVSGRHAEIRWTPDGRRLLIEDVGSRNGTWLNGSEVAGPTALRIGDSIQVGDTTFELAADWDDPTAEHNIDRRERGAVSADRGAVAIEGGMNPSGGGVGAGRDIHGDINTRTVTADYGRAAGGDYYEHYEERIEFDPTGLNRARGFARFLLVLGILVALAGFGLFGYPIVRGFVAAQDTITAHSACDQQYSLGTPENFNCHFNVNSGMSFEITPWIPAGAGLMFVGMVLTVIARVIQRDDDDRPRRRGRSRR